MDLFFDYEDRISLFDDDGIKKIQMLPDGKILVLKTNKLSALDGEINLKSGQLIKLNSDYSLDTTFKISEVGSTATIHDFDITSDGGIIVVGDFNIYNGIPKNRIVKLFENGEVDGRFVLESGPGFNSFIVNTIQSVKVLSNGKILISGKDLYFGKPLNAYWTRGVARLLATGLVDQTFKATESSGEWLNSINVLSDGKIVYLRSSYLSGSQTKLTLYLVKLNEDGSQNTGYGNYVDLLDYNSFKDSTVPKIWVQKNDKIVIYKDCATKLARFLVSGERDVDFDKKVGLMDIKSFCLNKDNSLLVIHNSIYKKNLSKLAENGDVLWTKTFPEYIFDSVFSLPDDNIFILANWYENLKDGSLIRKRRPFKLSNDGEEIKESGLSTRFAGNEILRTANDEYLILGTINNRGPLRYHKGIKCLNLDGKLLYKNNLYNSFSEDINNGGIASSENQFYGGVVQADGKILLFKRKYLPPSTYTYSLIRLNSDFSIDTGFQSAYDLKIDKVRCQKDGKIFILTYKNIDKRFVRLNSDGSMDNTFNLPILDNAIADFEVLSNDKILLTGNFTKVSFNGNDYPSVGYTCLKSDGSFDPTFVSSNFMDNFSVQKILPQKDGKIIFYGFFRKSGETKGVKMVRLNSDFSFDTTFSIDPSVESLFDPNGNNIIQDLKCQADNKIYLVLSKPSDINYSKLVRINENGSLDAGFDLGGGFNRKINSIYVQDDGNLIVTGEFTRYNGRWCNGTVRLLGVNGYNISGTNKVDFNLNGCDVGDKNFNHMRIKIGDNYYVSGASDFYSVSFSQSGTYAVTPLLENPNYFTVNPENIIHNFASQNNSIIQNFCITPKGFHPDLEVFLIPIEAARPGFEANYKLVFKNKGNQLQSGTVTLNFDDNVLDFVSSIPSGSTSAVNFKKWNFYSLYPYETREISLKLKLNSPTHTVYPLKAGSLLNYNVSISSDQKDEIPNDNNFTLNQTVVNSFDPNDKTCLFGSKVGMDKVGEYAYYVIRFENSGTYSAQNINVTDIIDTNKFDINTLVPLKGSAFFTTKISEGNRVEFKFDNINLPYTNGSNTGYVAFKIKTKSTLVSGDTFGGLANIYFDYNYPITTNNYTTTIQALSNQDFNFGNYFSLYPNPVSDVLNINKKESIEIASIHIYNVLGQLMMVIPNAKNVSTIDVSNLLSGNYFVKINSDKGTSNTRFIKK